MFNIQNHTKMENNTQPAVRHGLKGKSLVFGVLVILLGIALFFRNLEPFEGARIWDVIFSWQMLLIAIGLVNIVNDSSRRVGWILIAIGGFFMIPVIFDIENYRSTFWPALLIIIGLILIFGSSRLCKRSYSHNKTWTDSSGFSSGTITDDFVEEVAVFGGRERFINSQSLKGAKVVSVFGGSTLDMTKVELAPGNVEIEIVAIFGGSTLVVPNDWNIKLEVFNIFGGYSDKRIRGQVDFNKTVIVKGVAIFGGGEIKSY